MDKKLVFGIGIVLLIGLIGLNSIIGNEQITVKAKPNFNVNEVSYKVAVGKPEVVLFDDTAQNIGEKGSSEITVYNQDFALVKDVREMFLEQGINLVQFKDIASGIDATSVFFQDLSFPSSFVVEQNYEYDLVSKNKILEKYLDKEITVQVVEGDQVKEYTGVLLSFNDGIVLNSDGKIIALSNTNKIEFTELPGGLLTKPTLVWKIYAEQAGNRETQTVYLTTGLDWRADYIATVNDDDTALDFTGWTTITNNSGTGYPDTKLKLVAGDIHRVQESPQYREVFEYAMSDGAAVPKQFGEEALFEYYLYTLDRKTTINNNETKQISLLSANNVSSQKEFVYDGQSNGNKVQVKLRFNNSESQGLGMPLPKGIVRVYKKDSDGQLQFVGEDEIDHTKTEDELELFLGNAFDVTGERTQTNSENFGKGFYKYEYKIKLENQKDEAVNVIVKENLGSSWTITKNSLPYDKKSSSEIEFNVNVPAKGEAEVTYTVEYRYYY
ncbi:MAG: DUF4139 domain-containing protein [Candidatus Diapherotrites archaeon]|uniref:DUF4139 domain-containing protein n=1 Tax=Candidatus Iainarchaeum sp. TaxID=3101447 RepID=A0A2D6LQA9_9ARCH|nr:DUF4139 domain-containing protein [Candidatus Diapherotrites archaeon]